MIQNKLCKDNVICCDDNCKRCANLIYEKYMEQKAEIERLNIRNKTLANIIKKIMIGNLKKQKSKQ